MQAIFLSSVKGASVLTEPSLRRGAKGGTRLPVFSRLGLGTLVGFPPGIYLALATMPHYPFASVINAWTLPLGAASLVPYALLMWQLQLLHRPSYKMGILPNVETPQYQPIYGLFLGSTASYACITHHFGNALIFGGGYAFAGALMVLGLSLVVKEIVLPRIHTN